MVTKEPEEMSHGTGWMCQAMRHFEASSDCTLSANRDEKHRYYRCNLGRMINESVETSSETGTIEIFSKEWNCRPAKNHFGSSNTSIPLYTCIDDAFNEAINGRSSFVDLIHIVGELIELRYERMKNVVASAVNNIRYHWMATDGITLFHRAKVVNKLIGYYLVSMAIYIIEISFWTNRKLFRLLGNLILEQRGNIRVLFALCIVAAFMLLVYLLGGEGLSASSVCENEKN